MGGKHTTHGRDKVCKFINEKSEEKRKAAS
jgi:hypothetical protein